MDPDPLEIDAERAIENANRMLARVPPPDLALTRWWTLHMAQADLRKWLDQYAEARPQVVKLTESLTRRTSRLS